MSGENVEKVEPRRSRKGKRSKSRSSSFVGIEESLCKYEFGDEADEADLGGTKDFVIPDSDGLFAPPWARR